MRHQNDVTKFFHFQAPHPLAKSWLHLYVIVIDDLNKKLLAVSYC